MTDEQSTETEQEQGGADSPEGKAEQAEERDTGAAAGGEPEAEGGSGDGDDEVAKARKAAEQEEEAKKKVKELEKDPPERLEDWPDDKAKYETFGGAEGEESYEDSVTSKLGPSSLRYREDGGVEIEGEEVDDPDEFKGDPIPGGPTDPRVKDARAYGEPDLTDETSVEVEGEGEGSGSEGDERPSEESDGDSEKSTSG